MADDYGFDYDVLSKYQAQTAVETEQLGVAEELFHGAIASVVDFGTSTWNSLDNWFIPGTHEASTSDILSRIDSDALQVYNEHPDAVHTASLIGGTFVPAGLALKGMQALRAGAKGMSWFSAAGETARYAEVANIVKDVGVASAQLNNVKTGMYAAMAANALVDSAAMELAIVGTMNAHPYMEDYMEDFGSNFLLWTAIGGGIGAGIGAVTTRAAIRSTIEPIEQAAYKTLFEGTQSVAEGTNLGNQLLIRQQNISNWEATLAKHNDPSVDFTLDRYTTNLLEYTIQREKASLVDTIDEMAQGILKDAPAEYKTMLADRIGNDLRFGQVDTVSWANLDEAVGSFNTQGEGLMDGVQRLIKTVTTKSGKEKEVADKVAYSPEFDAFVGKAELHNYTSLADTGVETVDDLAKQIRPNDYIAPRNDAVFDLMFHSSGQVEADYAKSALFVEGKESVEQLAKIPMHPDDLPLMKAVYNKLKSLPEGEAANYKGVITKEAPSYNVAERIAIGEAGFSPNYKAEIAKMDKGRSRYQVYDGKSWKLTDTSLSQETGAYIKKWLGGSYDELRKAALAMSNPQLAASIKVDQAAVKTLQEIKNSARSRAFREDLAKLADADGNVLLYRGLRQDPKGHHALESYTLNPGKAKAFTSGTSDGLRMYKVHVDSIIGTVEDFATTTDKAHSNMEILVMARQTRENAVVPLNNIDALPSKFFGKEGELVVPTTVGGKTTATTTADGLMQQIIDTQMRMAQTMKQFGMSPESIAKRLGMSTDAYKQFGASTLETKFLTSEDIVKSLGKDKRTLVLGTNLRKAQHTEIRTNLNSKNLDQMNSELTSLYINASQDPIIRSLGKFLGTTDNKILIDSMIQGIDEITQSGLKSTMLRSVNSALEEFGVVGKIATVLGKDVTHFTNTATEAITKPISEALGKVVVNDGFVVEMNMALAVNASLKGPRIYKNGEFLQKVKNPQTGKFELRPATYMGKPFKINSPEVRNLFDAYDKAGRTMYELRNVSNKILGQPPVKDLGFWVPSYNPRGVEIGYALEADRTSIIVAKDLAELNDKVAAFERTAKVQNRVVKVVTRGSDQEYFNKLNGRQDPFSMQMADVSMHHSGSSAPAIISTNSADAIEMLNSYDHFIRNGITNLVDIQLSPVMQRLDMISDISQRGYSAGNKNALQRGLKKPADPGAVVKNTLLGKGQLNQHEGWMHWQQNAQIYTDMVMKGLSDMMQPILETVGKAGEMVGVSSKINLRDEKSFKALNDYLVENDLVPFKGIDEFLRYQREGTMVSENMTPRLITLTNAAVATSLLRFMELAQPFVNMISMPILMSGALRRINDKAFMGSTVDPNAKFNLISSMYDGVRLMMHPTEAKKWRDLAVEKNLFKPVVSEANEALAHAKSLDPGMLSKAERLLQSDLVKKASIVSDTSEQYVREMTFFTGVNLAKKAYPGLSDIGVMTYARGFMDEAIGNYAAAQRPALFQGTFGVAMGLFQTYMLTLAQQMYRGIEHKDWIGLSKQMFAQSSIFGMSSLPGFQQVSEAIGTHLSDNHVDLYSGTIRAVSDPAATMLLYGLPSSIGPGIATRGDIQPRIPNPFQIDQLAAVNITKQAWQSLDRILEAATTADKSTGRAVLEALSLQSVSRPVARISELGLGYSLTQQGNIVDSSITANPFSEDFTAIGLVSRIMATRPVEEIKARDAMYLDNVYKAVDREKHSKLIQQLKTYVRSGTLTPEKVMELQYEYMRNGSPQGWRSALNNAMRQKVETGEKNVKDMLRPDAPYNVMVDDLDI